MSGAAPRRPDRPATIEDLFAIPEELRRHELVDGEIIEKGAATGEHGATQAELVSTLIVRFGRRPGGRWPGGWWFATEVEIVFGDDVFRPDVVGWRRDRVAERPTGTPPRRRSPSTAGAPMATPRCSRRSEASACAPSRSMRSSCRWARSSATTTEPHPTRAAAPRPRVPCTPRGP